MLTKDTLSKLQPKSVICRSCRMPNHYADTCKQVVGKNQEKVFSKKPDKLQKAKNFFHSPRSANINALEADGEPEGHESDAWYAVEGDQNEEEEDEEEDDTQIAAIFISQSVMDAAEPLAIPGEIVQEARIALVMTESECLLDSGAAMSLTPNANGATRVWDQRTRLILPSGETYDCTQRCTIKETPFVGKQQQPPISIDYVIWPRISCKILSEKALCVPPTFEAQRIILRSTSDVILCEVERSVKKITPIMQGYWCVERGLYYMPVSARMASKNPQNHFMNSKWDITKSLSSLTLDDEKSKKPVRYNSAKQGAAAVTTEKSQRLSDDIMGASFSSSACRKSDVKDHCESDEELARKMQSDITKELETSRDQEQADMELAKQIQEQEEEEERKRQKQVEEDAKVARGLQLQQPKRRRSSSGTGTTPRKSGRLDAEVKAKRLQEWMANRADEVIQLVRKSCDECHKTAYDWIEQHGESKPLDRKQMTALLGKCRNCVGMLGEGGCVIAGTKVEQCPEEEERGQSSPDGLKGKIFKAAGEAGENDETLKTPDGTKNFLFYDFKSNNLCVRVLGCASTL